MHVNFIYAEMKSSSGHVLLEKHTLACLASRDTRFITLH